MATGADVMGATDTAQTSSLLDAYNGCGACSWSTSFYSPIESSHVWLEQQPDVYLDTEIKPSIGLAICHYYGMLARLAAFKEKYWHSGSKLDMRDRSAGYDVLLFLLPARPVDCRRMRSYSHRSRGIVKRDDLRALQTCTFHGCSPHSDIS